MRSISAPSVRLFGGWGATALCLSIVATFCHTPTALGAEQDTASVIEEIVVTSRRRDESQQEVPVSVTAFSEAKIERLKPVTLRDFDGLAPNVYVGMNTAGPSASAIYIRGVGYADIEKTQQPQVGVIVDGLQMGSSTGQLVDVFDIESLEINRGPQGVLYGKNSIGGTVVINRVRPQFNEFGIKARVELGNYDSQTYQLRLNVPLVDDTLALKVGANKRERDGFYDNLTLGQTAADVDFESQTVALRWDPSDNFSSILTYDRIDDQSQIPAQDPRFNGDQPFENLADKEEPTTYKVDQLGLRMQFDFDRFALYSITGWHDGRDKVNQDFDGAAIDGAAVPFAQLHTLRDQEFEVFTQELRFEMGLTDRLDMMLGGYYFDSSLDFRQDTNNVLQLPPVALGLPDGVPCAAVPGLRPNPGLGDLLCQFPNARSTQIAGEDVESFALFGALTWQPTDAIEVTAGARYIDEEKKAFNSYFDYSDGTFDPPGTDNEFDFSGRPESVGTSYAVGDSWDDVIFMASGAWHFADGHMAYASYSEGFRSGGFSIRSARDPSEAAFDPEVAWQGEVGLKNTFLEGRMLWNIAYFYLERDGSQFSSIITLPPGSIPGTTTIINNGGEAVYQGIETEFQWSLTDSLLFIANVGWLDVDNKAFSLPCDVIDGCTTGVPGEFDPSGTPRELGGNSDSRQPDWNYSVQLAYDQPLGRGHFAANIGYKYVGDFLLVNTGGGADQRLFEGSYGQLDARISYDLPIGDRDMLTFSVFGKNLTDTEWKEQALFLGGPNTGFQGWGAPQIYAFEVMWNR